MKLTFCGAARTVTGSCHLLSLDNQRKILFDCGLYQGREFDLKNFNESWKFKPEELSYVILSHAHIDHSGRIPKLIKDGFNGPIYCTYATRDLCAIMLMDSAFIQERDADWKNKKNKKKGINETIEALYSIEDVEECLNKFVAIGYDEELELKDGSKLTFRDAGHILGSASVHLTVTSDGQKKRIGFTGDIGRPDRPILRDPIPMEQLDYLICESTYGNKIHPDSPNEKKGLLNIIKETCEVKKGKLIIPAFSVGRTQEIVYMIDQMQTSGDLPKIPIYVDSPLSINATEIFKAHPECYDSDILRYLQTDPNPFGFNGLHYIRNVERSKRLNDSDEPCVIISASGMATAGRIVHHINNNIEDARNTILIVGYCAQGSLGARLAKKDPMVRIFGQEKKVKATIKTMHSFSAHGDQKEMIEFIDNQDRSQLKGMFLVHGDYNRQIEFKDELNKNGFKNVEIPNLGESFKLS
ncbi:MAG: metallo-beta-lactamase family protein [Patiriisocius sp.]|jgi:metallo-beta-lactamase family protein